MIGRNRFLRLAVASAIDRGRPKQPSPAVNHPPTEYDLAKHAELHKLSGLIVQPVPAGHEKAPDPKKFNVEGGVLYVLDTDWPALKDALDRQRGRP